MLWPQLHCFGSISPLSTNLFPVATGSRFINLVSSGNRQLSAEIKLANATCAAVNGRLIPLGGEYCGQIFPSGVGGRQHRANTEPGGK